jgi:hypothetical protein
MSEKIVKSNDIFDDLVILDSNEKRSIQMQRQHAPIELPVSRISFMPMIRRYFKRLILSNKEAVLMEVLSIKGLMHLLMKIRNTDERWTSEEKKEIKSNLRNIAKIIPAVAIFCLPGGSLLLPVLAEALDRRKAKRP